MSNALVGRTTRSGAVYSPYSSAKRVGVVGATTLGVPALARYIYNLANKGSKSKVKAAKSSNGTGKVGNGMYSGKVKTPGRTRRKRKTTKRRIVRRGRYVQGVTLKQESRGTVSDANAVYIGCGSPGNFCAQAYVYCVLRELFKQAGWTIESWSQPFGDISGVPSLTTQYFSIEMRYHASPSSTVEIPDVTQLDPTLTMEGIENAIISNIRTAWTASTVHEITQWTLRAHETALSNNFEKTVASIDANRFKIKLIVNQNLLVQNRTKSGVDVAGETADTDNIYANPLYGVVYKTKGNGFYPKWRPRTDASYLSFHADAITGVISNTAALSLPNDGEQPNKLLFKGTKTARDKIEPGAIKQLYNKSMGVFTAQKFLEMFRTWFAQTTTYDHCIFGNSQMIGYEKMLSASTAEPDVTIGYENNQTITAMYQYSPSRSIPAITLQ